MNNELCNELVTMRDEDQKLLRHLFDSGKLPSNQYHPKMKALHEKNAVRLKEIIQEFGWPGISIAGKEGAEAAWLIAQHSVFSLEVMSDFSKYLSEAVKHAEAEKWQLAFLQDRILTMSGQPQKYGTQFDVDENGWPKPFPIEDENHVDERRLALGLNSLQERWDQLTAIEKERREKHS